MIAMRFCLMGVLFVLFLGMAARSMSADPQNPTDRARHFIELHEKKLRPLEIAAALAWWQANISGSDEDFKRKETTQNEIDSALSDTAQFKELKDIRDRGGIADLIVRRAMDVLYLAYLEKQVDPALLKEITACSNEMEKKFNKYRPTVDGKELTDNEVRKILKESTSSDRRREVWEASKGVGKLVDDDLRKLVRLRNDAAKKLGFKNYHALMLHLAEQDSDQIMKLFDDLDELTREPFRQAKKEIDATLAAKYNIAVGDLMPWHYHDPFFQETPFVFRHDIDKPYAKADILKLCAEFYEGIGLPIADVIARSDLHEKKGKNPHAFCTDIDRAGDVRVLANIVPNAQWASTMLHEFGHAVYSSKNIPKELPYVLRGEAHILTTEGVAMMFERLSKRRAWLERMGEKVQDPEAFDETAAKMLRYQLLIFSRWCQVMLRFEKAMYENPDQDLAKLWWDLVEKYQELKRPTDRQEPDYASKIHIVIAPVYYHNYMMGELFASQLHHAIAREIYKEADPNQVIYVDNKEVGAFMKKRVFEPGRTLPWNQLTKHATGAELNARAFAADFKGK